MRKFAAAMLAGAALSFCVVSLAHAKGKVIGVSWSNFQERRALENRRGGDEGRDHGSRRQIHFRRCAILAAEAIDRHRKPDRARRQRADRLGAGFSSAVAPAVQKAVDEGIPVIGDGRPIEIIPNAFYITFDNKEVGRMQARGVFAVKPLGNYAFIKGIGHPFVTRTFCSSGQMESVSRTRSLIPARSRMSARSIPTAGCRPMCKRTWSRS